MTKIGRPLTRPKTTESLECENGVSRPKFADNFPYLWEFLQKQRDFGEIHKTGCITLFVDGIKIKACVNDRPARQSCFVSADGVLELFARVDRGLMDGSLSWTRKGYQRRARG